MKILIADDDDTIRLISESLTLQKDVEVVSTNDGHGARDVLLDPNPPDVAILNCVLPNADGIEICRSLKKKQKGSYTHVIIVSNGNLIEVFNSIANGFNNILMKPLDHTDLQGMVAGLPKSMNSSPLVSKNGVSNTDQMTKRQKEILGLLAQGYSNNEIAERLGISVGTIKSHIHQIFSKLSAESRVKAIIKAQQMGLV